MTEAYLLIISLLTLMQIVTLYLWRSARTDADHFRAMFFAAYDELTALARNSVRRDPRTGRYLRSK